MGGRAHFLCCLPARLGVLLFSLGDFLSSGALAALLWIVVLRDEINKDVVLSKPLLIGAICMAVISSIIALCSLAGFLGAILKRSGGIRAYTRVLAWLLGIQIGSSILYIISIYLEPKADFVKQCEAAQTNNQSIVDTCNNRVQEVKGITVGLIVVNLIAHAYELYVVGAYASELAQKEINKDIILGTSNPNSRYAPLGHHGEDSKPLYAPDMTYPYADAHHQGGNYA